jgi:putative DNA primase/helicase
VRSQSKQERLKLARARARLCRNLKLARGGNVQAGLANLSVIMRSDPEWMGVIAYDERGERPVFLRVPPLDRTADANRLLPRPVTDDDYVRIVVWAQHAYGPQLGLSGPTFAVSDVARAVHEASQACRYDEVRDRLDGLVWDGTPRLDTWLIDYAGATDTPLTRAVAARWVLSAVARAYLPGAKVDSVLVLEGPQGIGKSSLLRVLAGPQYFADDMPDLGSKDAAIQLRGPLIIELAELDAVNRAGLSQLKAFLSRSVDRYRRPYGREAEDYPRRVIFAGTTNEATYLRDPTGARRFWPVRLAMHRPVDLAGLGAARDQLWAEAVYRYRAGEQWYLHEPALIAMHDRETSDREVQDPWAELVARYVSRQRLTEVTTTEILGGALRIEVARLTKGDAMRVGQILRQLGWTPRQRRVGDRRVNVYVRPGGVSTVSTSIAYPIPMRHGDGGGDEGARDGTDGTDGAVGGGDSDRGDAKGGA